MCHAPFFYNSQVLLLRVSRSSAAEIMFVSNLASRFVWIAKGMSPVKRMRHIEERWAYYFAFG